MNILRTLLLVSVCATFAHAETPSRDAMQAAERIILPRAGFQETPLFQAVQALEELARSKAASQSRLTIIVAVPPDTNAPITFRRENASMLAVLREIATQANCRVEAAEHALILRPNGAPPFPPVKFGDGPVVAAVRAKLAKIVLPRVDFRHSTVREAIEFVVQKMKQLDPDGTGVSVVTKIREGNAPAHNPAPAAVPGIPGLPASNEAPVQFVTRVNLRAHDVPVLDLLQYIAGLDGLQVVVSKTGILIEPARAK